MRSDEALQAALAPATPKDFSSSDTGFAAAAISNGASLTGSWFSVRGYRRIGITVQAAKNFSFFLLGQVGSLQSTANLRVNATAITNNGSAGNTYAFVADLCCDAVAVMISNTDAASGAFTVVATALP